jgi:hypothetical protein
VTRTARSSEHMAQMRPATPAVFGSQGGPTSARHRICLSSQPRGAYLNKRVGEVVPSGGAYFWRPQGLAPEQRNPGSPPCGGADWSRTNQGAAAYVAHLARLL